MSKDTEIFEIITQRIKKIFQRVRKINQRNNFKKRRKKYFFLRFIFLIQRNISIFATYIQILCKTLKA